MLTHYLRSRDCKLQQFIDSPVASSFSHAKQDQYASPIPRDYGASFIIFTIFWREAGVLVERTLLMQEGPHNCLVATVPPICSRSVVGLTLALALEKAGIDWELFEKGEIAPQLGASFGLHPPSLRILDQLGVWDDLKRIVVPLEHRQHMDCNNRCFEDSYVLRDIHNMLGRPIVFAERCKVIQFIYNHIQNKDRVHSSTIVVGYEETGDTITIRTDKGRLCQGSILIGADGIHSHIRTVMAEKIRPANPALAQDLLEGFTSEYNAIFAISHNGKTTPFMPDGTVHNVYYDYYSAVAATGEPGSIFWFLFVKSSKTKYPNCSRFTETDAQDLIDRYGDSTIGPGYTVRDLWETRVKASLVPMEEGVLKQWRNGRVLLMGDSVHKTTVNAGLGGNLAYEGIARFTNLLVPLLQKTPNPSTADITELFLGFERLHRPRADLVGKISGQITRYEAQDTVLLKFASRYIAPWVSDWTKASLYASFAQGAPWLEYLPLPSEE
ncbi:hypothetical protein DTO027B5_3094 [Paecilomyces variotii]|nr:hypothetical protein DTO021C3_6588 [Paecilomyces variotii]KAJ9319875.1 hypothetical protein DTO027B3_9103 [Paecilomyces variotii]KAJ9335131.1 hypothetical protein DTO027B5_3094 [Paecilomyces variotii]